MITVARSHQGFPAILRKKFSKILKKFCIVILAFFKGFKNEIFCNKPKFKTPKIYFLSKLPLKKLKTVRKCFPAPFLPLLVKIWGRRPPNSLGQKIFFTAPFELFWRIFGHLGTVIQNVLSHSPSASLPPWTLSRLASSWAFLALPLKACFRGIF